MLHINLSQPPILETNRLILRGLRPSDAPALFGLRTNDQVMRYIDRVRPKDIAESEAAIQKQNENFTKGTSLIWAVELKIKPGPMIGNLGFWNTDLANHRAELGYMLHPDYWRQGILTEALSEVLDFGFTEI
jgi:ribosomal-protein-alanine N-acetyltransferase